MKKTLILIFVFCSAFCYSQTWIEKVDVIHGVGDITQEYTVITKEQFDRLVNQYKATNTSCKFKYIDVLEEIHYPVISGIRPKFNGYYFLISRIRGRLVRIEGDADTILIYGNSSTGKVVLEFGNSGVKVNTNEYIKQWNQFIGWVNGK